MNLDSGLALHEGVLARSYVDPDRLELGADQEPAPATSTPAREGHRAEAAGYRCIVVTHDTCVPTPHRDN